MTTLEKIKKQNRKRRAKNIDKVPTKTKYKAILKDNSGSSPSPLPRQLFSSWNLLVKYPNQENWGPVKNYDIRLNLKEMADKSGFGWINVGFQDILNYKFTVENL